jgi:hypothetical protein
MAAYGDFEPERLKHLDLLQAVISRLGGNGFLVKGWALTLAGAFYGFAVNSHNVRLAIVAVLPTLLFWLLDSYFLRAERLFRKLHRRVRTFGDVEPFFMSATSPDFIKSLPVKDRTEISRWRVFWRPALSLFYGAIIASAGVIVLVDRTIPGTSLRSRSDRPRGFAQRGPA